MTLSIKTDWTAYIDSAFESDSNRYIRNANAYILSGSATKVSGVSVTLEVKDSADTQQYLLTQATTPPVVYDSGSILYYVDQIDVTAFPEGTTKLIWTIGYSGSDYILTSSIDVQNQPSIVLLQGATTTLQDYSVTLDQAKVYTQRFEDSIGNPFDGAYARVGFYDGKNGSVVEYANATLQATGSGLWTVTHTLSSSNYVADLNRYELFWQVQPTSGPWSEVESSRHLLQLYGVTSTSIRVGDLTFCSNQDLRTHIAGLSAILSTHTRDPGEIEIILNQKRKAASAEVSQAVKIAPGILANRELLRQWEIHLVWRKILIDSMAFSKMAASGLTLTEIEKEIYRLKSAIFGAVSQIRIESA